MDIGKLDKRIRIERKVETVDPVYGSVETSWQVLATVWANVVDHASFKDNEVSGAHEKATIKTRLRIRYRSDIDATMRVVMSRPTTQVWQISSTPIEIGNRDGIEFTCERAI